MRLSMVVGDRTDSKTPHIFDVFLDGIKQTHCVIADEELGMVRRYKKTKLGTLMHGRTGFMTEDKKGVVKIVLKSVRELK